MATDQMTIKRSFTSDAALAAATELGIDFEALGFDLEQFGMGMDVDDRGRGLALGLRPAPGGDGAA